MLPTWVCPSLGPSCIPSGPQCPASCVCKLRLPCILEGSWYMCHSSLYTWLNSTPLAERPHPRLQPWRCSPQQQEVTEATAIHFHWSNVSKHLSQGLLLSNEINFRNTNQSWAWWQTPESQYHKAGEEGQLGAGRGGGDSARPYQKEKREAKKKVQKIQATWVNLLRSVRLGAICILFHLEDLWIML